MSATYRCDHAADPELFERLMRERYGPLDKVLAERNQPGPPGPDPARRRRHLMARSCTSTPDPDAAEHLADLKEAIAQGPLRGPAPVLKHPPAPGMTWCHACDGWCTAQGICGCNNR
ncbi:MULTISPECIES: hypothetical protein [unclassified Streptomyces]|uniref:hypothetical protein n=1 Tax=unclassified Streptomyces TaxID=2593676 RepID=UPI002E818A79|nr:hypothetical protein [Streptomyces sp. NBC_00589]WTI37497.1 hypothetical protein OIC96_22000 [Streptomyces sp. NBC_00775]WUB28825.1 hypothetical protein OHA51_27735 [Streptomyces sp. NBC_00589]